VILSRRCNSAVNEYLAKAKGFTMPKFDEKSYEPLVQGMTGYVPAGTDDSIAVGGGSVFHEFTTKVPTNLLTALIGVTVAGAGAGVGTGTPFTTIVNQIRVWKGTSDEAKGQGAKLLVELSNFSFIAAVRASVLRCHSMLTGLIPTFVDPAIAANGVFYGASLDLAVQLTPGTYTLEVNFLASTAVSYPTFATPPTGVAYNIAATALFLGHPVTEDEIWVGNALIQAGLTTTPVREVYVQRAAAIAGTLNRLNFDLSINAYGVQAMSVKQAAIVLVTTGAAFPFYRSSEDKMPHPFNITFTGAAALITYVVIA
jgi:hypothetical protein